MVKRYLWLLSIATAGLFNRIQHAGRPIVYHSLSWGMLIVWLYVTLRSNAYVLHYLHRHSYHCQVSSQCFWSPLKQIWSVATFINWPIDPHIIHWSTHNPLIHIDRGVFHHCNPPPPHPTPPMTALITFLVLFRASSTSLLPFYLFLQADAGFCSKGLPIEREIILAAINVKGRLFVPLSPMSLFCGASCDHIYWWWHCVNE